MIRSLPVLIAIVLLAAAGAVAAQSPEAKPPAPPVAAPTAPLPERPRAGGSSLNLQLDDSSRRRIMSGASEEGSRSAKDLPSLGGDARKLEPSQSRSSPYPHTSENLP